MIKTLPLNQIKIDDSYWNRYTKLIPQKVIPYQWEVLNDNVKDANPSYCLENFRLAAIVISGVALSSAEDPFASANKPKHRGMVFQDSDAAKWLEAVAYSLAVYPDPELEKKADEVIELIGQAQESDGYINTYFTINCPDKKWKNLNEAHELYCAGHLMEAAVAYFETTGKKRFLEIMCRFADLICKTFGPASENKIPGYPGHPEVELALVKLYNATGNEQYLKTAKFFIDERGASPNYFTEERKNPDFVFVWGPTGLNLPYSQSHKPVREQDVAEGHSVRALYLYCGMADVAELTNDTRLLEQCKILWDNIVQKQMYITGSVGSSGHLERFTVDYDLPNDANYSETCASIALAMFGQRMARITQDATYFDAAERALYNTVRAGISLEGDRYFYVNPLEVWPQTCMEAVSKSHIKPVRQKWFDCACCPTNVARTFTSLGQYIYFYNENDNELFVNLFIQNEISHRDHRGTEIHVSVITDYPKSGNVKIKVSREQGAEIGCFSINIRIPDFADDFIVSEDGERKNNYYCIKNIIGNKEITVSFSLKPKIIYPNPKVHQNCGKVAIARGPEIFCFEECDNGKNLASLSLDTSSTLIEEWRDDLLGGIMTIKAKGKRIIEPNEPESFSENFVPKTEEVTLTAIPYGYWQNRVEGEMLVWIRGY